MLALATGKARSYFFAWPEHSIPLDQEAEFAALVKRRCEGEPIAYITGRREFWSREFQVTPDVLIPRPETELLVEVALEKAPKDRPLRILDLGTGSGAIAITLALELPLAQVTAVDISPGALSVAHANATRLGARNVRFMLSNWYDALEPSEKFDLIVSNPPYIAEDDPHLKQGDVRFEPSHALRSRQGGAEDIQRITADTVKYSRPGTWLLIEHGFDQAARVREHFVASGFMGILSHCDLLSHERVTGGQWC